MRSTDRTSGRFHYVCTRLESEELQTAVHRLQALPEEDQAWVGARISDCLTKLERLREMVRDGLESGPTTPLDMDEIIRRGEGRLARRS